MNGKIKIIIIKNYKPRKLENSIISRKNDKFSYSMILLYYPIYLFFFIVIMNNLFYLIF